MRSAVARYQSNTIRLFGRIGQHHRNDSLTEQASRFLPENVMPRSNNSHNNRDEDLVVVVLVKSNTTTPMTLAQ